MVKSVRATVARLSLPAVLLLGIACSLPGCGDDRTASANDVVFLFESAKVGAKTWRLPEPAQGYVDGILKSYAKWNAAHAPMEEMNGADALWAIDSPKWQSADAINETLLKYAKFRESSAVEERGKLADELREAIGRAPQLPGGEDLADRIARTIWGSESTGPTLRQVESYPVAKGIEVLLSDVQNDMDKLDHSKTGLYFTDDQVQSRLHERYNAIEERITEMQAAELEKWQVFLKQQSANAAELAPKVRKLGETMTGRADTEYRRQKLRLEYHEDAAKFAEKRIKALKKALKQDEDTSADTEPG